MGGLPGAPSVGIVGGGLLGLAAAHRLLGAGVRVAVYERAPELGGLVSAFDLDGHPADRFYHVVLPTDHRVIGLAEELGLAGRFRFSPVKVGFYDDGRLFSMSSLREFLTFPLLRPRERARLGAFVAWCQRCGSEEELDALPLEAWLRRRCGDGVWQRLWRPLLDSKFDGRFDDLPATYLWARSRRMSGTRDSAGREVMGWLDGGYRTLVDALADAIRERGGEVHLGVGVDRIAGDGGGVRGLVVDGRMRPFDAVLCTLLPPQARRLMTPELALAAPPDRCRYLGVVCAILRTPRPVSPYYTLNLTDRRIPLTTVVQTTHVVDPEWAGGHLLYAARYVSPDHGDLTRTEADVLRDYVGHVRAVFPDLADEEIEAASVQRARMVEPVHLVGGRANLPDPFAVPGLALASTVHVYPEVVNGQAVLGVAERTVTGILRRLEPFATHRRAA
jgi:protoporphyrinogen oxidase